MGKIQIKSQKEFTLNSVKFKSKGGLSVEFQMQTDTGTMVDHTIDSSEEPHPDLVSLIEKLKEPVLYSANGLAAMNVLLNNKIVLDQNIKDNAIKKLKKELTKAAFEDVRVHGVHFYHINDGFKVKIVGGFDNPLGYSAITTPHIGFQDMKHGFEEELKKTLETLTNEVYKYIANDKRAQPGLFDEPEEKEKAA